MHKTFSAPAPELSEDELVLAWRETWLLELGFSVVQAVALAAGPADRARVKALLKAGCPHALVTAILA